MRFANCAALAAVLFTTLTKNLRLCSFAEDDLFLNLEQKLPSCSYKIVLIKKVYSSTFQNNFAMPWSKTSITT